MLHYHYQHPQLNLMWCMIPFELNSGLAIISVKLPLHIDRNLPLVSKRIAFAQKSDDVEYLISAGWIIARKLLQLPANASAQSKAVFRGLLDSLFVPYASLGQNGKVKISNQKIAAFYLELTRQIGTDAITIPAAK